MIAFLEFELTSEEKVLINLAHVISIMPQQDNTTVLKTVGFGDFHLKASINEVKYMLTPRPQMQQGLSLT